MIIDRNVNNSVATQKFNIMNEANDQVTDGEEDNQASKQSIVPSNRNAEPAAAGSEHNQDQEVVNDNPREDEEDKEENEASEESFDPGAEYERLKLMEEQRLQDEMAEKMKVEMSNMFKKMKDHIFVIDKSKNLPPELPKNLIYWHRTKTEVCN